MKKNIQNYKKVLKKKSNFLDKELKPPKYTYTVSQILISLKCFFCSSVGFRGLANIFTTLKDHIYSFASPCFTTIRQWVLKLGLYKLERPKHSSQGWFFIIDTSIQMGLQKCVLVLGVKKGSLVENFCPKFDQVEVLALKPLESCPGEVINDILEEASAKVGCRPIAIISDAGSELKKGVRLFSNEGENLHLFDVSHKIDACLKAILNAEPRFKSFLEKAGYSVQQLKLSPSAHLLPPRQRTKARMHSSFSLIDWGIRLSSYMHSKESEKISVECRSKIAWIEEYQEALQTYKLLMEVSQKALQIVHKNGYYRDIANDFVLLTETLCRTDLLCLEFQRKIASILNEEGRKVPDGQHYLGSSEIIESLFGKFKEMEDHHVHSGLTSLVLAMPALTGEINESEIEDTMKKVTIGNVQSWLNKNMGETFLSKRKRDLRHQVS